MHHPVARPPFAGMMSEFRRKAGEQKMAAGLEQRQHAVEVAPGVAARHMVKAAVIDDHIEGRRLKRQREQVRHLKRHPAAGAGVLGRQRPGPLNRQRLVIDADHPEAPLGGVESVPSLAAPEVEHQSAGQPRPEPSERGRNARLGPFNRPAVFAALIGCAKIAGLSGIEVHGSPFMVHSKSRIDPITTTSPLTEIPARVYLSCPDGSSPPPRDNSNSTGEIVEAVQWGWRR